MNSLRYNAFNYIHKALRALLYETALKVQQTDFTSQAETEAVLEKIEMVLSQFENHAHHEDRHILPAVMKYAADTANEIESEHIQDEMLTLKLENKIKKYQRAVSSADRKETGEQIMYTFIEFVAFNLTHMNKEEHIINEILWNNYTDEQLMQLAAAIRAEIPPQEMITALQLMIRGVNDEEMLSLLTDVKNGMPAEAFTSFREMASLQVSSERWKKVYEELSAPVQV